MWKGFDLRIEDPPPRPRKTNSSKSASIGGESKASKSSGSSGGDRPRTSDREAHSSARRPSQSQSNHIANNNNNNVAGKTFATAPVIERDSKVSIRDDPFFRPYQTTQSVRLAGKAHVDPMGKATDDASKNGTMPPIHLAVLGATAVGKSTFIQRALDLRQLPNSHASAKKMSLDGVIYLVRLIEVSLEDVSLSGKGRLNWPTIVDGHVMPLIDGVMVLCDVTNRNTMYPFDGVLGALSKAGVPSVLVACKCDAPPRARQIQDGSIEQMGQAYGGIESVQTSANVPESQKRCISILLRAILAQIPEPSKALMSGARAESIKKAVPPDPSARRLRQPARLDTSKLPKGKGIGTFQAKQEDDIESIVNSESTGASDIQQLPLHTTLLSGKPPKTPTSSIMVTDGPLLSPDRDPPEAPSSPTSYLLDNALRPATADSQVHNTFLNMDDDDHSDIVQDAISQPIEDQIARLKMTDKGQVETGNTFDELVDRLLALPMSKPEGKYVPIFLCLYRKFAAPGQLLSAILGRFEKVEKSGEAHLTRVGEQLRYLQILAQWTGEYPGDFGHSTTRNEIIAFVTKLERSRIFTYAAREISNHLDLVIEDDDTGWACHDMGPSDKDEEPSSVTASSSSLALTKSKSSTDVFSKESLNSSRDDLVDSASRDSRVPSMASSLNRSGNGSTQSLATLMTYEEAQREAKHLNPVPRNRLTKILWRHFMAFPGEEIARELTRIDWIMYSSIRPRDLVRHVSLSGDKKEKMKSLENVNRMINHFNHVALFVSSMVLLRDKPKHRAMALEKFMHIAWKLRQQNNYNSLGSVIAGINGTAIHRLALTRELVPPQVQKEFMRLVILMGTGKSHFAYRLAWDNSFSEKIPFLPLHRRDLVAAEDGNRTLVGPEGDRINWKKFEIMGDVIIEIQRSQDRPYPYLQRNDEILQLVLETKFLEGDEQDTIDPYQELYERSVQLEPTGAADAKKGFGWLRGR